MRRLVLASALACGPTTADPASSPQPAPQPSAAAQADQANPSDTPGESQASPSAQPHDAASAGAAPPPEKAAPVIAPAPNTLRLVVVHAPPDLLASEAREIQALEENLQRDGLRVTREPASDDERAFVEGTSTTLPPSWARFEIVIALRIADPRVSKKGKRFAQGIRDLLILRPPDASPIVSERTSAQEGPRLDGDAQARSIRVLIGSTMTEEKGP